MVVFVIKVVKIINICACFHFVLVVSDTFLLKEDIDIGWLFVGKVDLEKEATLHLI